MKMLNKISSIHLTNSSSTLNCSLWISCWYYAYYHYILLAKYIKLKQLHNYWLHLSASKAVPSSSNTNFLSPLPNAATLPAIGCSKQSSCTLKACTANISRNPRYATCFVARFALGQSTVLFHMLSYLVHLSDLDRGKLLGSANYRDLQMPHFLSLCTLKKYLDLLHCPVISTHLLLPSSTHTYLQSYV